MKIIKNEKNLVNPLLKVYIGMKKKHLMQMKLFGVINLFGILKYIVNYSKINVIIKSFFFGKAFS